MPQTYPYSCPGQVDYLQDLFGVNGGQAELMVRTGGKFALLQLDVQQKRLGS